MNGRDESILQEIERALPPWLCVLVLASAVTIVGVLILGAIHLAYVGSEPDRWIVVPIVIAALIFAVHYFIYGRRGC